MNKLFALFLLLNAIPVPQLQAAITFSGPELLGKPTDTSITINVVPDANVSMYFEYGTAPGVYAAQTPTASAAAGESHEVVISGLLANTQYYYRMQYAEPGDPGNWIARDEHSFWTQRTRGSTYAFTITSDSHINVQGLGVISQYRTALDRIATNHPDFNLDLGDTFNMDGVVTATQAYTNYLFQRSSDLMGRISPSIPIFLAGGNHENEEGWNFDDTYPQPIFSINARKRYFPTPIPDAFYSGNADASDTRISGDHLREDYYAWQWGDALFVVIDPFQYTMNLPYDPVAGEGTDDTKTGDQWSWTLGAQQFNWLKATLQNSNAKYKFVFSHQMLGGITNGPIGGAEAGYVRGGAEAAGNFEWGGNNADGTPGFSSHRNAADFGTKPIHQLMVENGVSAYFHGHDHQFVYEKRDGIVYQLVPSPCMSSGYGFNLYTQSPYVQPGGNLPNSGYLRITISPSQATVDYVKTDSGSVAYSYTIAPNNSTITNHTITATARANGGINPSGAVVVTAGSNQCFTITPNSGYGVADVSVDGVSQGAVTSYSFTNVVADHTISASFAGVAPAGNITYVGDVGSVSSNAAGTTLPILVGAGGVATGNTIVVGFASRGASPYNVPTVSDTAGNTYTLATNAITYQHGRSYIYFAHVKNALVNGNKLTITTSSVASRVAVASVFSGLLDANLLDKTLTNPTGTSTTAQGNNLTVGPTATTVQANELIIGVIGTEEATDAGVGTWQNSFIPGPQIKTSGAAYDWRVSLGYQIVSATGQFTAAKTVANNPYWAASIATFKAGTAPDTSAPTPNPATFAVAPTATGPTVVTMTATVGTDATGPVEYLFTETSGHPGGSSSGWQTSQTYVDTGLNPATTYSYTVTMRDALANTSTASAVASVSTPASGGAMALISDTVNNGNFNQTNAPDLLWAASLANRSYSLVVGPPPGTPSEAANNSAVYGVSSEGTKQGLAMDISLSATAYTIALGNQYDLQFRIIPVSGWEATTNQTVWSLFYTSNDTLDGVVTQLFGGTLTNIGANRTGSSPNFVVTPATVTLPTTAAVTNAGAVGKKLFFSIDAGTNIPSSEFARLDDVFLSVATVLSPAAPTLSARPILLPNGHFYAGFTGAPNMPYTIMSATNILGPWETLTNITSDGSGLIQVDAIPAAAPPKRFYRVVYP